MFNVESRTSNISLRGRPYIISTIMLFFAFVAISTPSVQGQTFEVVHVFHGSPDGSGPTGDLSIDEKGNLYGTTTSGGTGYCDAGCGTVFMLSSTGKLTIRHSFTNIPDGANPNGRIIHDSTGNWYGTTANGGTFGFGTVFKIDKTGKETVLYSFHGTTDGAQPNGDLAGDATGNLYGTTVFGGDQVCECGVIFKIDKTGKITVLYSFIGGDRGPDGAWPHAGVIRNHDGSLYGTTSWGSPESYGSVFKLRDRTLTILHGFSGSPDGRYAFAPVMQDRGGNLYGTTQGGGQGSCYAGIGCGIVFEVDSAGTETILHVFGGPPDGAGPLGGLIRDDAGTLYGTTAWGGTGNCFVGCGTVYQLDIDGNLTLLHDFTGKVDGGSPVGNLVADSAGNLYGTAGGGRGNSGVIFKITMH